MAHWVNTDLFLNYCILVFRWLAYFHLNSKHSTTGHFNYMSTGLVQYLDPHCIPFHEIKSWQWMYPWMKNAIFCWHLFCLKYWHYLFQNTAVKMISIRVQYLHMFGALFPCTFNIIMQEMQDEEWLTPPHPHQTQCMLLLLNFCS